MLAAEGLAAACSQVPGVCTRGHQKLCCPRVLKKSIGYPAWSLRRHAATLTGCASTQSGHQDTPLASFAPVMRTKSLPAECAATAAANSPALCALTHLTQAAAAERAIAEVCKTDTRNMHSRHNLGLGRPPEFMRMQLQKLSIFNRSFFLNQKHSLNIIIIVEV
jgi:hypothetical protein